MSGTGCAESKQTLRRNEKGKAITTHLRMTAGQHGKPAPA